MPKVPIRFVCLTFPEIEGIAIRWDHDAYKSPELVADAIAAGFSEREARGSPLGFLEQDVPWCQCRRGARALMGTNGTTLLEMSE